MSSTTSTNDNNKQQQTTKKGYYKKRRLEQRVFVINNCRRHGPFCRRPVDDMALFVDDIKGILWPVFVSKSRFIGHFLSFLAQKTHLKNKHTAHFYFSKEAVLIFSVG
jgi:hypothetical protein